MKYENSYVAYLDILGFKDLSNNINNASYIYDIYNNLLNVKKDSKLYSFIESINVSILSDNIIVSCIEEIDNFYEFCRYIIFIQEQLIDKNIYFRGGIVKGELFHNKHMCFGPALVKAYLFEKELSIFPRVIVDEEIIKNFNKKRNEMYSHSFDDDQDFDFEIDLNLKYLFIKDIDGLYYLNLFNFFYNLEFDDSVLNIISYLRSNIVKNLICYNDLKHKRIFQKYSWMRTKYNENLINIKKEFKSNKWVQDKIPLCISDTEFMNWLVVAV